MSTPSHTPEPWHVYEGGNFVKIGAEGYDEYIEQEHYLGGPLCVADVEDDFHKREKLTEDHAKAMINGARIVTCVNALAGISDPATAIAKAVGALKEALKYGTNLPLDSQKIIHAALTGLRSLTKEQSQRGSQREESK